MKTKLFRLLSPCLVIAMLTPAAFTIAGCPPASSPAADAGDSSVDASPAPVPAVDPTPDTDDAASIDRYGCTPACANLAKYKCVEGGPSCLSTCVQVESSKLTDFHTACLAHASSKVAIRACKSVTCPE